VSVRKGRRFAWWVGATTAAVVGAQQAWVSPSNFQGFDEWLAIELTSRGVIGVPYANRPLVFLWQAVAQGIWPDNLRAYWALTSLAFLATGLLTAWMTHRLLPRAPLVVLLCAVFTAAWAPLDWLRLDTTLIAGYAGFTAATVLSLVLFVESWRRRSRMLLLCSGAVALICALGTESVVPVLAVAPALLLAGSGLRRALADRGRFVRWLAVWTGFVLSAALFAAAPTLAGFRSYQTGALKFDPVPVHVLARLVRLLAMQLTPAVASASHELLHPAVSLAVLGFTVGALVACRLAARATGSVRGRDAASAIALGLLLACAGHLGLALSASVRDPARSQLLSAPGVGLALAGVVAWVGGGLGRTLSRVASARLGAVLPCLGALALAAWIVAVGTGRVIVMQRGRGVRTELHFPACRGAAVSGPGDRPGAGRRALLVSLGAAACRCGGSALAGDS
jgi:hypothetical protein